MDRMRPCPQLAAPRWRRRLATLCLLAAALVLAATGAGANDGGPPPGEDYFNDYVNPTAEAAPGSATDSLPAAGAPAQPGRGAAEAPPAPAPARARSRARGIEGMLERAGLFQGLDISGQGSLTLNGNIVEGSEDSYQSQRWDSGSVVRQSSLHLEGPVWRELAFQADISNSGWGQSYTRWIAGYVGHDTALLYGDLDLTLGGNEFVGFRKSTKGWQLDQRLPGDGFARAFYTTEKGITRKQTIIGNDTAGPYFLTYTPVIEGSEVIKINEDIQRFGTDYRLDYDTGQLNFEPVGGQARIVTASDTISVSYQSQGYQTDGPSDIYGARAEMPLLDDRLLVGVTTLRQASTTSASARDTVGFQEDVYNGSGSTGPFDTSYRPIIPNGTSVIYQGERQIIDDALVVLMDGSEQVEGVDYDVLRSIGRIEFRRMVPPTSLVRIKYYYDLSTDADTGDRSLWGLDLAYQASDDLNLMLDYGSSSAGAAGSGQAVSMAADYTHGDLRVSSEYRDVQPGYTFMDTAGFQTRERGYSVDLDWQPIRGVSITNTYSDVMSDTGLSFGYSGYGAGTYSASAATRAVVPESDGDTALDVSAQRHNLAVGLNFEGWPQITLSRSTMDNSSADSGSSTYLSQGIKADYTGPGSRYSIRTAYSQVRQERWTAASGSVGSEVTGSLSDQLQTALNWNPSRTLTLSASYATNASEALESANTSDSSNLQLTARWSPSDDLSLDLTRSMARTDGRVSSSVSSYAAAAKASASTSADDEVDDDVRPSSEDSTDRLSANWRLNDRLSLDFGLSRRVYRSQGSQGYLADSDQSSMTAGASWQPSDPLSLNLSLSSDDTDYTAEDRGTVSSRSLVLNGNYRPREAPWSAGLTLNLQDGSSPTYVGSGRLQRYVMVPTDLTDISAQFSYNLRQGLTLSGSLGLSDYDGGYSVFTKTTGDLRLRYQLNRTVNLDFGYRYIRHISKLTEDSLIYGNPGSGESYIANTFSLAFSTSFSGGIGGGTSGLGTGGAGSGGTFGGYQPGIYRGDASTLFDEDRRTTTSGFSATGSNYATDRLGSSTSTRSSGSTGSGLQGRLGGFQRQSRTGGSGGRSSGQGYRPGGQGPSGPGRPAAGGPAIEDWWLLDDNLGSW